MFDPNFDPMKILEELHRNQAILNENQAKLAMSMQQIVNRLNQQDQDLSNLYSAVESTNKANEILLQGMASDIQQKLKEQFK
jgi:hypothetical protein